MKKKTLYQLTSVIPLLIIISLASCTKEHFDSNLTREFELKSNTNGAIYKIKVALPATYDSSNKKYSTLFVLDGEEDFDFVANKSKEISEQNQTSNVLVVGIGYGKDRSIDYTPTKISSVTGGAPEFLTFIESQLIPEMEHNFKADTTRKSRAILGHSYGGLFGTYAFCMGNHIFGNYILLSPSLWFDNQVSFKFEEDTRSSNKNKYQLVFMGIGDLETEDRMKAPFKRFFEILHDNYIKTKLAQNYVVNAGHTDSKNSNIIKGLNFYFQNQ